MVSGLPQQPASSFADNFSVSGGLLYFSADAGGFHNGQWVTDGTVAGTHFVRDLTAGTAATTSGSAGAALTQSADPALQTSVDLHGQQFFLQASPSGSGDWSLWESDSTGANEIKDVGQANPAQTHPDIAVVNDTLLIGIGSTLWRSDGTTAGTTVVKDHLPFLRSLAVVDTKFFFDAAPWDLWVSDGTPQGTLDLGRAPITESVAGFDHRLFYGQYDSSSGWELWSSDGVAGTGLFDDLAPGVTTALFQPVFGAPEGGGSGIREVASTGGTIFLAAMPHVVPYGGDAVDLFETNAGDTTATELHALPTTFGDVQELTPAGRRVFFIYAPPGDNLGLGNIGVSDGTTAGTKVFSTWVGIFDNLTPLNGAVLWLDQGFGTNGLWRTDGNSDPTRIGPADLNPALTLTRVGATAYFFGSAGSQPPQLWKTDGTSAGTQPIISIAGFSPTAVDGRLVFFVTAASGLQLWQSDGTAAGTVLVKSFGPMASVHDVVPFFGPSVSLPFRRVVIGNTLYFALDDGVHGSELWKTDGTEAGTQMVKDINPGAGGSDPQWLTAYNGRLYFSADDGTDGRELWTSDGTPQGTYMVSDINPGAGSSNPTWLTAAGGLLYFNAYQPDVGNELFSSDGTAAGTRLALDLYPGPGSSDPQKLTYVDGTLYFVASDPTHQGELWKLPVGPSSVMLDFSYFVTLARNYGQSGTLLSGDLNGDGVVNFDDLVILARNYGHSISPAMSQSAAQTPAASIGHDALPKHVRHAIRPRVTLASNPNSSGLSTILG